MFNDRRITSNCTNCGHINAIALNHFVGTENIFENQVIATCESCRKDFVVELYEADIY